MLSVGPEFKMQMLCRSTSGTPGQCDDLVALTESPGATKFLEL